MTTRREIMSKPLLQRLERASGPNTCQYVTETDRGHFLVQVAWPLNWSESGVPPPNDETPQTLFVVDGNAYFYTAVEIARRMEYLSNTRTVVVGIGYPITHAVYDFRRGPDLTPASPDGSYEMPLNRNGKPRTDISFGQAKEHLDFIRGKVMEDLYNTLLPLPELKTGRKALYGHSYGGIFVLYALFTAPTLFNTYIAASPIVWWNKHFLVTHLEPPFREQKTSPEPRPSLLMTHGHCQQDITQQEGETDERFKKRLGIAEVDAMREGVLAMAARLVESGQLTKVLTHEFPEEDHGSAAVTGLQLGIMQFLRGRL
ncbi:Ferri-bacillibactin esterase BesA [Venturia nashicola]|uniref:Ferri-bacillibactin esterase BesA n=1 Tax=Venturia nashicola TaxID=86259 RepID=A0A4Z1NYI4_9PEZI|nr:Ferri-bacillibactin esterase BesA [Venturia nashicola]TLD34469.1 Ferri-bacillibactin esterase BesA [Venturia nashicola]